MSPRKILDASTVPSTECISKMLKDAIDGEYAAIDQYKDHIDKIDDPYVCDVLERIIEDERYHIKLFKKLLDDLND